MKKRLIEKRCNDRLEVWKQSDVSYQGRIYLGWNNITKQGKYMFKTVKSDDLTFVRKTLDSWLFKTQYELDNNIVKKDEIGQNTFIKLVRQYLEEFDWKNNSSYHNEGRLGEKIIKWINDEKIKKINKSSLKQLRDDYLPRFTNSTNTISHYMNFIRRVYRHHKDNDRITKNDVPEFPTVKKSAGKRTYFTFEQYRKLINKSIERMNEEGLARNVQLVRKSLNRGIIFMIGSGLRTDECYNLKWEDITFHRNNKGEPYCRIDLTKSKTGPRQVITKPQSHSAIKELQNVYSEYEDEFKRQKLDRSKVFPFKYHSSFRNLVKSCDLYIDKQENKKRDWRSLRQTYISWSVINGELITDISKNCGNSIPVIEKYYIQNLTPKNLEQRLSTLKRVV